MINRSEQLDCVFIYLSKAFDYVYINNLWLKVIKLGVRNKMLDIVQSMYVFFNLQLICLTILITFYECQLVVRQGECLP